MRVLLATATAAAAMAALLVPPAAAAQDPASSGDSVTELIVAYEPGAAPAAEVSAAGLSAGREIGFGMRVMTLPEAVDQATAERIAEQLTRAPGVRLAAPNAIVTLADVQDTPTWGLDRIDERALPLDGDYAYGSDGTGVTAYVIDTGLRSTHTEFTGRVGAGYVATGVATVDAPGTTDCNGHGTHVAGTIAGTTYGVAKGATIVPVRVFGCSTSTTLAAVIQGIQWVVDTHTTGPAVANMSLTTSAESLLDTAVTAMIDDGITVVAASGNTTTDSCQASPGRLSAVITVNASSSTDTAASFSNYGACSDLYAPGVDITSAWFTGDSATETIDGTSMAAPHVAGVAARLLEREPAMTPAQVHSAITALATSVSFAPASPDPDLLLFAPAPPSAPQYPSVNASGTSIAVTWQAPASDGGSALTEYEATAWTASSAGTSAGTCQPSPATGLTCTITGLNAGTTYYVDVTAANAVSAGSASSPRISTSFVPSAPTAPRAVAATAGNATAAVTWQVPESLGGSAVTAYEATAWSASSGGTALATCAPVSVDDRACTLTGLTNGTPHYIAVTATNATGTGSASSPRVSATPVAPAPPAAPPASGGGSSGGSSSSGATTGGGDSTWLVTEVRPSFGPTSGGTTALVIGYGFTGATRVTVGGVTAPGFRFINDGTIEIVTPAGTLGWQDLVVWLPNGSVPAGFEYRAPSATTTATPAAPAPTASTPTPSAPTAAPAVLTLRRPPARTAAAAPTVVAPVDTAMRIRVSGLPAGTRWAARVKVDGRYRSLGTVRTTTTGRALLPAFTATEPGRYLIRLSRTGAKPLYLRAVAR